MNKVFVLGVGPGHKDYIPPITMRKIKKSDVLIGGKRILANFDGDQEQIKITANLQKVIQYIKKYYQKKQIAVLVSGDPGLYSFLKYLKHNFPEKYLEVIPGISSIQLAFAKNNMIWQDTKIISLHGQNNKELLLKVLTENKKVAVLTDNENSPAVIANYLLDNNMKNKKAVICENLSYPYEKVHKGTLKEFINREFSDLSVMVIYDE